VGLIGVFHIEEVGLIGDSDIEEVGLIQLIQKYGIERRV
jgi:hypothetical protein